MITIDIKEDLCPNSVKMDTNFKQKCQLTYSFGPIAPANGQCSLADIH